jgi:hypothetical protein
MKKTAAINGKDTVIYIEDLPLQFAKLIDPSDQNSLLDFTNTIRDELVRLRPDVPTILALALSRNIVTRMVESIGEESPWPALRSGCLRLTTTMTFDDEYLEMLRFLEESGEGLSDFGLHMKHFSFALASPSAMAQSSLRIHLLSDEQMQALKERSLTADDLHKFSTHVSGEGVEANDEEITEGEEMEDEEAGWEVEITVERSAPLNAKKVIKIEVSVEDPTCLDILIDQLFDEGFPLEDIRSLVQKVSDQMNNNFPQFEVKKFFPAAMDRLDSSVAASGKAESGFFSGSKSASFTTVCDRSTVMAPSSRRVN